VHSPIVYMTFITNIRVPVAYAGFSLSGGEKSLRYKTLQIVPRLSFYSNIYSNVATNEWTFY